MHCCPCVNAVIAIHFQEGHLLIDLFVMSNVGLEIVAIELTLILKGPQLLLKLACLVLGET